MRKVNEITMRAALVPCALGAALGAGVASGVATPTLFWGLFSMALGGTLWLERVRSEAPRRSLAPEASPSSSTA